MFNSRRTRDLAPSICIVFEVQSCRYCVPPGATLKVCACADFGTRVVDALYASSHRWLRATNTAHNGQSIARHYMLNMDWLRLYNSNPGVANPDDLLPQQAIQVGPIYSVAPGDTLLSIAGTTHFS